MITFPCPSCSFKFVLQDEMAGGLIQCPKCARLNDVPTLDDLPNLTEDGTYTLDEIPFRDEDRAEEARQVYRPGRVDDYGQEIDLRPTLDDIRNAGADEVPLELHDQARPGPPKYDPITGELIRPMDVAPDTDRIDPATGKAIPTARPVMVDYARADEVCAADVALIPFRLFKPVNLLVMFFILLAHAAGMFMVAVSALGFWLMIVFVPILHGLILAHYGNVIDEIGPEKQNELPAPARQLGWHDDTWGPFFRMSVALLLSYAPAIAMLVAWRIPDPVRYMVALGLAIGGTLIAPAMMLTATTSGSIMNLRPDRVLGVIGAIGFEYMLPVIVWLVSAPLYLLGMNLTYGWAIRVAYGSVASSAAPAPGSAAAAPGAAAGGLAATVPNQLLMAGGWLALIAGIYGMHFLCWHLGTFYRRHHGRFPWLFQRHVRDHDPVTGQGFQVLGQKKRRSPPPRTPDREQRLMEIRAAEGRRAEKAPRKY